MEEDQAAATYINGSVYVCGGRHRIGEWTQRMAVLDLCTETWREVTPQVESETATASVTRSGIGGAAVRMLKRLHITRNRKPEYAKWPPARYDTVCFSLDNSLVYTCGMGPNGSLHDTWVYSVESEMWTRMQDVPKSLSYTIGHDTKVTVLDGVAHVFTPFLHLTYTIEGGWERVGTLPRCPLLIPWVQTCGTRIAILSVHSEGETLYMYDPVSGEYTEEYTGCNCPNNPVTIECQCSVDTHLPPVYTNNAHQRVEHCPMGEGTALMCRHLVECDGGRHPCCRGAVFQIEDVYD
ncbi:hypothetical protein KIPB_010453 [Kipferlia bialata]|uniref:Uncharacterized protein n=1 Tax=Kipferlia bialata TaxID=797122 RepID=A0A9K3D3X9_9EUKA|nr:hypothetical protein KIPB_010453 [Kipferlia bialata]|eukprot:g10453.t1